jgi:transmembrane sensor
MKEEIDWNKLGKYFADECTDEERKEVERWIATDPEAPAKVAALQKIWEMAGQRTGMWDVDRAWSEFSSSAGIGKSAIPERLDLNPVRSSQPVHTIFTFKIISRVAAALLLFLGLPYVALQMRDSHEATGKKEAMREISADRGQRTRFKFSDGTMVTLNGGSVLRFPDQFSHDLREISLEGEALFEVTRLNGVPFIVRAGGASIEVLGTQFSVKAWPGDSHVQVVVAEGKVAFRSEKGKTRKDIILMRGQMSVMTESGELSAPLMVNVEKELSWTNGRLVFDKTSLRDAIKSLDRRYNLVCLTPDTTILSRRLTALFKDEPTNEVLKIIALSLDLRYRRDQDTVLFLDNSRRKHSR